MKFLVKPTAVTKVEVDLLAVFAELDRDGKRFVFSQEAKLIDKALTGMLAEVSETEDFEAKSSQTLLIHSHGKVGARRILLVGLGKLADLTMIELQEAAAAIGRKAKAVAAKSIALALPREVLESIGADRSGQGVSEGLILGTYSFLKHKNAEAQAKEKVISEAILLVPANRLTVVSEAIFSSQIVSEAVIFARDLVNEPPSVTTPTYLGETAKSLARGQKQITAEVLGRREMQDLGMGALLGIARGSAEEPKFIKLEYRGSGRKTVCLVGKGITFDTGGLSLKSAEHMETMKLDMAGAAAILAIFKALGKLKLKVNVVGLISATENMPGSHAIKPGDIVRALNGKTIEILNTDAEGRVVLADALSYACLKVKPDILIDLATLTGACMVALGEEVAGIFANDRDLVLALKEAAEKAGERLWELPLVRNYQELLKSSVADIKNVSKTRYGGAITAALFLGEFVGAGIPWAHLDIAGPAFAEKDSPLAPPGGTGFGVRLILEYLTVI